MLSAPELLTSIHDLTAFDCGEETLNKWLKNKALANQASGASKTYVICDGKKVVGYYCLAASAVALENTTARVRRNMPDPVPMMIVGRLAIDQSRQGKGLGRALLKDAILRTLQAAEIIGVRGIFVHALSQEAKKFYEQHGFQESPISPMMLMCSLKDIEASVSA